MKPARKFGKKVYYFKKITSTMDIARELAEKGEPEGSMVIAERQVYGRGRLQRKWYSPSGGIYFSLILRPTISPSEMGKINLLAAVSLAETLKRFYALPAKIKWPNDVLVRGKKISGILTEMNSKLNKIEWVILGIGINANNPQKKIDYRYLSLATSVKEELGKEIPCEKLVKRLLIELERNYFQVNPVRNSEKITNLTRHLPRYQGGSETSNGVKRKGFTGLLEKWKRLSDTLGREVKIDTAQGIFVGNAVDIDSEGALILELSNGEEKKILAGDCCHLIGRP